MRRTPNLQLLPFALLLLAFCLSSACGDEVFTRTVVAPTIGLDGGGMGNNPPPNEQDAGMDSGQSPSDGGDAGPVDEAVCGDGKLEGEEACDDGNRTIGDGCDVRCRIERCGNGRVDINEECDDDNQRNGDGCSWRCRIEHPDSTCGDAIVTAGLEQCDDGNLTPGDGCDDLCLIERCGDGRVSPGEDCDPPVAEQCTINCLRALPNCGDGTVQADEGEACDDANNIRGDGCNGCRLECGNGRVEPSIGEQCEPAYAPTRCNPATCRWFPLCGDGIFQPEAGEECDIGSFTPPAGLMCTDCRLVQMTDGDGGVPNEPMCVPLQALIPDGAFNAGAQAWQPRTRITISHELADGAAERGAMKVVFSPHPTMADSGLEVSGAERCVRIAPETAYEFRGLFRVQSNIAQVAAQMRVAEYPSEDCTGTDERIVGLSLGSVPGPWWIPYERPIMTSAGSRSIKLILSIVKPRNVFGHMLWDDISLRPMGAGRSCGDCEISAGETCDDGNLMPGDGCNQLCEREVCGDGVPAGDEACDDGNVELGDASDTCTPGCRLKTECESCITSSCASATTACYDLEGTAADGPGEGMARSTLCDDLRACVRRTGCAGQTAIAAASQFGPDTGSLDNCYCGTADELCFEPGEANGQCKEQIEAALETTDSVEVLARLSGAVAQYPIVGALSNLLLCEGVLFTNTPGVKQCEAQCGLASACGDGLVQDRTSAEQAPLRYLFTDSGGVLRSRACSEDAAYSQLGCWIEECDDGNLEPGDGCDAACFLETCGNGRLQEGEECDDGNNVSGDGCDASCGAEFDCGDGTVVEPFEECDPPNSGMSCTQAEYEANPEQCGCDSRCRRKVCGDGVTQDPEQCDPPGPACNAECMRDEDECVGCLRLVDQEVATGMGLACAPDLFLDGPGYFINPSIEIGCQNDPACYDLLLCALETQCSQAGTLFACYCGESMAQQAACYQPSFEPAGVCKDEMLAAFASYKGGPPASNEDFWSNFALTTEAQPGRYPAGFVVGLMIENCVRDADRPPTLGDLITASGYTASEAQQCMDECFP